MADFGLKIFDEDLASDMRGSWNAVIFTGGTPQDATAHIKKEFAASLRDVDEESAFWLALAALQERAAALESTVRDAALQVIESGSDLKRWEEDRHRHQRQAELTRLRTSLLNPRTKAVAVRKRFLHSTSLEAGDVFSYRRVSRGLALFRVYHIDTSKNGDRSPFVELLDYDSESVPADLMLDQLRGKPSPWPPQSGWERDRTIGYVVQDDRGRPEPGDRIDVLLKGLEPRGFHPYRGPYMAYVSWENLDVHLDRIFGTPLNTG